MFRKIVAVWISLAMLFGFVVIMDVITDITPPVKAATLYVGGIGPGNYTSIQWAIDNATDGDTVFVYNGTYFEHVIVNKTINLTGENKDATIIDGGGSGVVVSIEADWVNITGFTILNGGTGINIWSHSNNNITGNLFTLSDSYGLRIIESSNNSIMFNQFSDYVNFGMSFSSSSDNKIIGNYLSSTNFGYGMFFDLSSNNNLASNIFVNNGIFIRGDTLSHYNSYIIPQSNTVNGKSIFYYNNQSGVELDGIPVGQLILANCTDFTVKNLQINNTNWAIEIAYSSNIYITNNSLLSNEGDGIYMYSSSNNIITNNNISNNQDGINIRQLSNNNTIMNNDIFSNSDGIHIRSSYDNIINNNNAIDNTQGIELWWSSNNIIIGNNASSNMFSGIVLFYESPNNRIDSNIIFDNMYGIRLRESSNNNTIRGNKVYENTGEGIYLDKSNDNMIIANNASNNFFGIYVGNSFNNTIRGNHVMGNLLRGITVGSSNNRIYHNNIFGNPTQAMDFSSTNYWDNGYPSGGNYWSDFDEPGDGAYDDYQGSDQNILGSDGIVDNGTIGGGGKNPYVIDSDSQDNYPLIEPFDNIIILKQGWNLISIPLIQDNQVLSKVLEMIDSYYDAVQWHNLTDPSDTWKHYRPGKTFGNDLSHLNETMGFWIHITNPGDTIFLYNGTQPTSNQSITLHPGWNNALNNLNYGTDVDAIWTFNAATQTWQEIGPSGYLELGRGYWIHSKVTKVWDVPL
jgi:parallel beta-helix repeat protein